LTTFAVGSPDSEPRTSGIPIAKTAFRGISKRIGGRLKEEVILELENLQICKVYRGECRVAGNPNGGLFNAMSSVDHDLGIGDRCQS
jgi:hypothetical protein